MGRESACVYEREEKLFLSLFLYLLSVKDIHINVYFNIKTFFFFFYMLFQMPHIRLSILHYISLKYQIFLIFLIVSLSSHTKKKKKKYKMNNVSVNLYNYYCKHIFLHNFTWLDVDEF